MQIAESCQGVICRKSSAERSANYPLSLFRIPQPQNIPHFHASQNYRSLALYNRCATHPQQRQASRGLSFRILCGPFAKEQGSYFTISTNFKVFCIPSVMSFRGKSSVSEQR